MYIANCPFNKMKILGEATIGLEKSFPMMHSNIGLNSRETVPLKESPLQTRQLFAFKGHIRVLGEKSEMRDPREIVSLN